MSIKCHASKFANMAESFMKNEEVEFHKMREEFHSHKTYLSQLPSFSLGICTHETPI